MYFSGYSCHSHLISSKVEYLKKILKAFILSFFEDELLFLARVVGIFIGQGCLVSLRR